jgi:galactokinase
MKKSITVQSPGRINIIGEHTDYNDGFVLPAAIDKKTIMHLAINDTPDEVGATAKNFDDHYTFNLNNYRPIEGGWQNYVMGVVHELQKMGAQFPGFNLSFEGDVPIGGGMSSSAALECSLAFAMNELFSLGFDKWQLIKASQMAEHNFVGIKCGIMDQFASMMGKKGQVMLLDCRSLAYSYFPFSLGNYQLVLLNTNVSHSLASSEYNTRRSECEEGTKIIQSHLDGIKNLRDVNLTWMIQNKELFPDKLYDRCFHVVSENQRVLDTTDALKAGEYRKVGKFMYASHHSLQYNYEVSCPELDFLVEICKDNPYVLGSRMMGGGFGGCTINVVHKDHSKAFIENAAKLYRQKFSIDITPYSVSIEDGTKEI